MILEVVVSTTTTTPHNNSREEAWNYQYLFDVKRVLPTHEPYPYPYPASYPTPYPPPPLPLIPNQVRNFASGLSRHKCRYTLRGSHSIAPSHYAAHNGVRNVIISLENGLFWSKKGKKISRGSAPHPVKMTFRLGARPDLRITPEITEV